MSDLQFGLDLKLERILGMGGLEQLGKEAQKVFSNAVKKGALEGNAAALAKVKTAYQSYDNPTDRKAFERLYKEGLRAQERQLKEAERIEKENLKRKQRQEDIEARTAVRLKAQAMARAARAAERDAANAAKVAEALPALRANVLNYSDPVAGYGASFLARKDLNFLNSAAAKKFLTVEQQAEAAYQNLLARSASNDYADRIKLRLPASIKKLKRANDLRNFGLQWLMGGTLSDQDLKQIETFEAFTGKKANSAKDVRAILAGRFGVGKTEALLQKIAANTGITAGLLAGTAGKLISDIPASYWNERSQRNYLDHRMAAAQRTETVGTLLGAILGGVAGGLLTGGNPVGIAVGAGLGGPLGGLPGKYNEAETKARQQTMTEAVQRVFNRTMYGAGGYSTSYARAVGIQGLASEQDVAGMAGNAATLRGRMMLGQVGEQEMYYYSMLPNYFAALLAGVTGPELAELYKSDLDSIADPSLRMVIGTAVGGGSTGMYAYTQSPLFDSMHSASGLATAADRTNDYLAEGVVSGAPRRAAFTLTKELRGFADISRDNDPFVYNEEYDQITDKRLGAIKNVLNAFDSDSRGYKDYRTGNYMVDTLLNSFMERKTTVIVNVDGVERERIEFKEDLMNAGQTMIVGSI